MVYRLRCWRKAIEDWRVFDAIDWLAQCMELLGARSAVKSLRHPTLCAVACQALWGRTKALVSIKRTVAA
jgi:hypothetical protein